MNTREKIRIDEDELSLEALDQVAGGQRLEGGGGLIGTAVAPPVHGADSADTSDSTPASSGGVKMQGGLLGDMI